MTCQLKLEYQLIYSLVLHTWFLRYEKMLPVLDSISDPCCRIGKLYLAENKKYKIKFIPKKLFRTICQWYIFVMNNDQVLKNLKELDKSYKSFICKMWKKQNFNLITSNIYKYSDICLNQTLNKLKTCLNQTSNLI